MRTIHILTAAALVTTGTAQAQTNAITNGDFSSGPSGLLAWVVEGDVAVVGPTRRAALTTASVLYEDDAPLAAGFNNNSGQAAVEFGLAPNLVGLDYAVLDAAAGGAATFEGSAIRQDFFANAGDTLTVRFDWAFLSADTTNADFGFVAINNTVVNFVNATSAPLASTFNGTFGDMDNVTWNWSTVDYTYTATTTGTVSLALGVVDVNGVDGTSELRVDNLHVTAVPEPETWGLALAGLLVAGVAARRRRA